MRKKAVNVLAFSGLVLIWIVVSWYSVTLVLSAVGVTGSVAVAIAAPVVIATTVLLVVVVRMAAPVAAAGREDRQ